MSSPIEPASPISEDSFDSPPAERIDSDYLATSSLLQDASAPARPLSVSQPQGSSTYTSNSSGKRRLPGSGSYGSGSSARDPKTRRREEVPTRRSATNASAGAWQQQQQQGAPSELVNVGSRPQKGDDFLDHQTVERLRLAWGDPFDESNMKAVA